MQFNLREHILIQGQLKNYQKGVHHVENISSFRDFTSEEQQNFMDMLNATDKGAHYIEPYYQSGYESSLIDLDTSFFITNNVKSLKQKDAKIYILDGSGFIIIDQSKQEIRDILILVFWEKERKEFQIA